VSGFLVSLYPYKGRAAGAGREAEKVPFFSPELSNLKAECPIRYVLAAYGRVT
jgi:hypothetical protein